MALRAAVFLPLVVMLVCFSFWLPVGASEGTFSEYGPQIEDVEIMLSEAVGDLRGKHLVIIPWPGVSNLFSLK